LKATKTLLREIREKLEKWRENFVHVLGNPIVLRYKFSTA
jgi:hypothetical protein